MTTSVRCLATAVTLGVIVLTPAPAAAQAQQPAGSKPAAASDFAAPPVSRNSPVVWVITTDGQERKGRLVSFTSDQLVLQANKTNQTIATAQIARVDTTDSLSNGVRNGTITGLVLGGLGLLAVFSACDDCGGGEEVAGGILVVGVYTGLGAGFGALIDHLIDGRRPIYTRTAPSRVSVGPILGRTRQGIQLLVKW
jgi:hypothetical protein